MYYIHDYYGHLDERRRAAEGKPDLLVYCLDLVEASLWSLAGGQDPQALVQLDSCVEIALKAELEAVHGALIADTRRLEYEHLKQLLKDSFMAHPRGSRLKISDFDMEHTITFTEAKRRVRELVSVVKKRDAELDRFHEARNEIVHYGPDRIQSGEYARMIATTGFPLLAELLSEIGSVDFERLVTPPVWRELGVATRVCDACMMAGAPVGSYCLKTVRWRVLHDRVHWPVPDDYEIAGFNHREYEVAERVRKELEEPWELWIDHHCKICGGYPSFVAVEPETAPARRLVPLAVEGPKCGLSIEQGDRFLAALHIDDSRQNKPRRCLRKSVSSPSTDEGYLKAEQAVAEQGAGIAACRGMEAC
jgi:hypothetical protein